jgi:membrane associated rhomboid family serine protease
MYIFSPIDILKRKEYYRIITSAFLHGNLIHLIFNMFSLYSFGENIELFYGIRTLLIIYFSSILGGGLLSLVMHRNHSEYRALGASGGVCGVIYASIFLLPGGGIYIWPCPFSIPAYIYAILFLVGSFFAMRAQIGNIGHDAHLGGAIVGLLVAVLLQPAMVFQNTVLFVVIVSITIVLFGCFYLYPRYLSRSKDFSFKNVNAYLSNQRLQREREINIENEKAINKLLDKISQSGMHSLTKKERKKLEILTQKKKNADKA